jgi:hypothetical protein
MGRKGGAALKLGLHNLAFCFELKVFCPSEEKKKTELAETMLSRLARWEGFS